MASFPSSSSSSHVMKPSYDLMSDQQLAKKGIRDWIQTFFTVYDVDGYNEDNPVPGYPNYAESDFVLNTLGLDTSGVDFNNECRLLIHEINNILYWGRFQDWEDDYIDPPSDITKLYMKHQILIKTATETIKRHKKYSAEYRHQVTRQIFNYQPKTKSEQVDDDWVNLPSSDVSREFWYKKAKQDILKWVQYYGTLKIFYPHEYGADVKDYILQSFFKCDPEILKSDCTPNDLQKRCLNEMYELFVWAKNRSPRIYPDLIEVYCEHKHHMLNTEQYVDELYVYPPNFRNAITVTCIDDMEGQESKLEDNANADRLHDEFKEEKKLISDESGQSKKRPRQEDTQDQSKSLLSRIDQYEESYKQLKAHHDVLEMELSTLKSQMGQAVESYKSAVEDFVAYKKTKLN